MKTEVVLRAFAQRHPAREALVCENERLTYEALERRTNRIANGLRAHGVGRGDRVALFLGNGIPWVETALGIIKCGALAVPISTRLTHHEVAYMLADSTPRAIVSGGAERATAEAAAALAATALWEVEELPGWSASEEAPPVPSPLPDDCLIGYTSGTSGRPKGAITTHANLLQVAWMNTIQYGLRAEDRILVTTPFAHRTAIARLWNMLVVGATLVIMPRFEGAATLATIARERVTVAGLVPTVARMLLDSLEREGGAYPTLRMMISVGEAFPVELKGRLFAALPGIELYSALGMTEAFGAAVLLSEDQIAHAGAAGRPIPGVEVRLIGEDGRDVATGEVGEILIRAGEPGAGMTMRGYFNRPEETAAVLKDGWMHTGDLGRFDSEGFLYVVDRKTDMILSGALNIYSKEVEQAILAHPSVADVAVVGVPDRQFGEAVVAFIELRAQANATEEQIVEHCRTLIASYKKPKRVYFERLPRNAQGKVLKDELRARAR